MRTLKSFTAFILLFIFIVGGAFSVKAQKQTYNYSDSWRKNGYTVESSKSTSIEVTYSINEFAIINNTIDGETMQLIELPGIYLFNDEGMPDLPGGGKYVAIPQGATPHLKIVDARIEIIKNVEVAPAPRIPLDTEEFIRDYIKNEKVYNTDAFYPANPIQISKPTQLRGVDVVMLGITPFQYNPVTKELKVYRDIKVEIIYEGGNGHFGEDRLRSKWWDPILQDALINYSNLPKIDYGQKNQNKEEGEFEYIIIVPDDEIFISYANQLKDFRRKQGISTGVFTTTEIGGNNTSAIETFIDDAYNNWTTPPVAVLMMADYGTSGNTITCATYGDGFVGSNYCISDNFYADVDNDDLPDITFARMTAQNETHLETMVSKVLNNEMNPPTNPDFYNNPVTALGWQDDRWFQICSEVVGGFWNSIGKETVRINALGSPASNYTNGPWSTTTYANTTAVMDYFGPAGLDYIPLNPGELGGFTGGNATMTNNAINSGCFMFQHRDHGGTTGWGEPDYDMSDIDGLSNTDLPYIWSINCLTGKFDESGEVFAEKFHRYTSGGVNSGALGICAATESSYSFVNDTYVWGVYDNMWPDFMPDETPIPENRMILPAFANVAGKNFLEQSSWPSGITDAKPVTYYLFHHHGDAFLNVYSEVPTDLTVDCNNVILYGNNNFEVTVAEDAFIAMTYYDETEEEVLILGTAVSTGGATTVVMTNVPTSGSQVLLTITLQNKFRYEQIIDVITPSGPYIVRESFAINDADGNNNGEADYCETFNLDITLENVGTEVSNNVVASLIIDNPYIISISNNTDIDFGNIAAGETATSSGSFTVQLADSIPDQYQLSFDLSMSDNSKANYNTSVTFRVNAPTLQINFDGVADLPDLAFTSSPELNVYEDVLYEYNISVEELTGNENGMLDPGETAEIIVITGNTGHADFFAATCLLESTSQYVTVLSDPVIIGDIPVDAELPAVFTISIDEACPIGTTVDLTFTILSDNYVGGEYEEEYELNLTVGLQIEDFETGDFTNYAWTFGGNADWLIEESTVYEGIYSAVSGDINDSQTSDLEVTINVNEDGNISFWYKVSSESCCDGLHFYIDNDDQGEYTDSEWTELSFDVTAGEHTLMWAYEKDYSVSNGEDCAWVDLITFPGHTSAKNETKDPISITGITIPEWLNITDNGDGTGLLTGTTPTGVATYDVELNANDGTNDATQIFTISVSEEVSIIDNELSINIFPNPVSDVLNINFSEMPINSKIVIYDINGRVVSNELLISKNNTINIDGINAGIYLLELTNNDKTYNHKIIIK